MSPERDTDSGKIYSGAGPVWTNRALFRLLWPLIIEQILQVTMGAADTVMVSSVGEATLSGVNIIDNINNLLIIAFTALCTGGSVVVSQYIGRRDIQNARQASQQLVYVVMLASTLVMIPSMLFRRFLIRLIYGGVAADVMRAAAVYFLITALSYPFLGIYDACAALFRVSGNSRIPMFIALMVNVMNIAGNAFFIYGLHIGAAGAALSTLLSRITAALILSVMLIRNRRAPVSLAGITRFRLYRPMVRRILNVGIPSGLENSMFQIGRLMTQRIFTTFGTAAIAANAIASMINSFSFMPGNAYGIALITVVGQCVGAGDYGGAKRYTAKVMKLAYLTMFVICLGIYICLEPLVSLFSLSPGAHEMAKGFLRVHCVSMTFAWAMSFTLPNALRAAGDARYVMIAASVSMWTIRVIAAYLLTYFFKIGPVGVWFAMGADFVVRGTCYGIRWRRGRWMEKRVLT